LSYKSPYNAPQNVCECNHPAADHDFFRGGVRHPGCIHCDDCLAYRPAAVRFVAVGMKVMRGKEWICDAVSGTMAQRIARALNLENSFLGTWFAI
jgi:ferredoxin